MSKRDAILLASRAIAILQLLTAAIEITYLPDRLYSLSRYTRLVATGAAPEAALDLWHQYRLDVALLLFRFVMLMIFAWIFWSCGPRIERLLSPSEPNQVPQAES